jgi:hypothetical protein
MALKDLLVYVDQTESSLVRLRLAADLAVRHRQQTNSALRAGMESRAIGLAACLGRSSASRRSMHRRRVGAKTRRDTICFFLS